MTKKLNIETITNELEGSSFFPRKDIAQPVENKSSYLTEKQQEVKQVIQTEQQNTNTTERAFARSTVHPNSKRIITRNSFEIYEDQMDSLRKLSIEEKLAGKLGSMSAMVREAIDTYLHKRSSDTYLHKRSSKK